MTKKSLLRNYLPFGRVTGYCAGRGGLKESGVPSLKVFQDSLDLPLISKFRIE